MIGLNPNGLLVAGVALNASSQDFARCLNQVAKRLSCKVDLIFVVEPLNDYYLTSIYGVGSGQSELVYEIENERVKTNESQLKDYASLFDSGIVRKFKVLVGNVETALVDYAQEEKANAIVCGASVSSYKFIPSSLSVVLSLIKNTFLPLIVIPKKCTVSHLKQLSFMLTDNLGDSSKDAIVFCHRLQRAYPDCLVHHVHIIKNMIDFSNDFEVEAFGSVPDANFVLSEVRQKMQVRFGFLDELAKPESRYNQQVGYGEIASGIFDAIDELDPDFVIYGRHQTWHSKPLSFGSMPWANILQTTRPIIIVPK